jgi:hypothetical protein
MDDTEKAIRDLRSDCQNVHLDAIWRLFDSKDVRAVQQRVAALALGEIGDPRAVEPLARILDDGKCDPRLTENAIWSLCKIGDARALRPVLFVLQKTNDDKGFYHFFLPALKLVEKKSPHLVCANCFCRLQRQKIELVSGTRHMLRTLPFRLVLSLVGLRRAVRYAPAFGWAELKFLKSLTYYSCRHCQSTSFLEENISGIIAIFDRSLSWLSRRCNTLMIVNCCKYREPFDFDEIWIVDADDFDVEGLIIGIKNDIDEQRRKRLSSIPVYLNSESGLSQAKHNLLRDTFHKIEPLNKANYNSSLKSIDPAGKG